MLSTLWPHQIAASNYAVDRAATLLHCGMGTGKTLISLDLLERWRARRILVIAPLSVAPVWSLEVAKHGFAGKVVDISAGPMKRRVKLLSRAKATVDGPLIVVVNYDGFWRTELLHEINRQAWDVVICDEAHRLKSPTGKASKAARTIRARRKLALTGTPMPHSPMDVWALFAWLDPAVFGPSFVAFRARYAVVVKINNMPIIKGFKALDDLAQRMSTSTYHVERSVLQLPDTIDSEMPVDLDPKSRSMYSSMERHAYMEIESGAITVTNALVKLLRLQQLTSGFVQEGSSGESAAVQRVGAAKYDALVELLNDLDDDEQVVVFARFVADLEQIEQAAKKSGRRSFQQSGAHKEYRDWSNTSGAVLAAQIRSASEGIDLTSASYVVYWSLPWSLGEYEQSLARCHRPGQRRTVNYYYLSARDTVDESVRKSLRSKADTIAGVISDIKRRQQVDTHEDNWQT